MVKAIIALPALLLLGAAPPTTLEISVTGLRSEQGQVRLCLFRTADNFPDCSGDAAAIKRSAPAREDMDIRIAGLASGSYAVALLHDENDNGRLDKRLGIPREGIGFSRNPRIIFGPPSFKSARFDASGPLVRENIKLKYFL